MWQGDLCQQPGQLLLAGTLRRGAGSRHGAGWRRRRVEPLTPLPHPARHALGQPQSQPQRLGLKPLPAFQHIMTQTFVALRPGRRATPREVHRYFRRPLFALGFKAFSSVRGCTLTAKRLRTRALSWRALSLGSLAESACT